MADPSRAVTQAEWSAAVKILNQIRAFGNVNATNFLALLNSLETIYAGDYVSDASGAVQSVRSSLAGTISQGAAQTLLRPFLQTYAKSVIGRTDVSNDGLMWDWLYRYMIDNTLRVQSRIMTYGAISQSIGTGTVQVQRLTKDKYNFDLEGGYGDSKLVTCLFDQNTGTQQGNETWRIIGQDRAKDELQHSGSGLEGILSGLTADDSLLQNADFRAFGGTASLPTSLTGWTSTNGDSSTYYTLDSTNVYRTSPSLVGSTQYSLVIQASNFFTQKLTVRGTELDDDTPYLMAVVWNRAVGTGSGTLNFRMGGVTTTVAVAAQTGWVVTLVPLSTGQSCWYRNFYQNDLQLQIEWIKTSGTVNIGEVLFVPGTLFDGTYYWMLPSSTATWAAPKVRDEFAFMDGESASGGVNQRWNARASFGGPPRVGRGYLPHSNGSSTTWNDA